MNQLLLRRRSRDNSSSFGSSSFRKYTPSLPLTPIVVTAQNGTHFSLSNSVFVGSMLDGEASAFNVDKKRLLPNAAEEGQIEKVTVLCPNDRESAHLLELQYMRGTTVAPAQQEHLLKATTKYDRDGYCLELPRLVGSLRSSVMNVSPFETGLVEKELLKVLQVVMRGLMVLHQKGIVHGQVTPDMLYLVGEGEDITHKLGFASCGFDFASEVPKSEYMPRELYKTKSDIWMAGVLVLELAYGCSAFSEVTDLEGLIKKIVKTKKLPMRESLRDYSNKGLLHKFQLKKASGSLGSISLEFSTIIAKCLDPDPTKRPTAQELLQNNLLQQIADNPQSNEFLRCLRRNSG